MKSLFKILSILMIIGGAASLAVSIGEILFSSYLASIAGNGAWLIAYSVVVLIAGAAELAAGIFGARVRRNQPVPLRTVLFGLITVGLNAAVILIAMIPLQTYVSWGTWILSLLVPVLFTIIGLFGIRIRK